MTRRTRRRRATAYYVVVNKDCQLADGSYGWDSSLHSGDQIFSGNDLPYEGSDGMYFVRVGTGNKPSVEAAQEVLNIWTFPKK
jgi:hypothetical protein